MTLLSVTSCVYNSNKKEESIFDSVTKTSNKEFNNNEAELLAKFNEQNLNIILISSIVQRSEVSDDIRNLANKLIQKHQDIENKVSEVSKKKLIIIPASLFEKNYLENVQLDTVKYLETVNNILHNQVSNLTKLSSETTDTDYKILALQLKVRIVSNIKLVQSSLYNTNL